MKQYVCRLYPPSLAKALQDAVTWPMRQRISRINQLTDEAAALGLARPRSHDSGWVPRWRRLRVELEPLQEVAHD